MQLSSPTEREIFTVTLSADSDGTSGGKAVPCPVYNKAKLLAFSLGPCLSVILRILPHLFIFVQVAERWERRKSSKQGETVIWNEKEISFLSDEKCKGNVEGKYKLICNKHAKGGGKKSENSETEGREAVTENKFMCKKAMKQNVTKSQRNFSSAVRLLLL